MLGAMGATIIIHDAEEIEGSGHQLVMLPGPQR